MPEDTWLSVSQSATATAFALQRLGALALAPPKAGHCWHCGGVLSLEWRDARHCSQACAELERQAGQHRGEMLAKALRVWLFKNAFASRPCIVGWEDPPSSPDALVGSVVRTQANRGSETDRRRLAEALVWGLDRRHAASVSKRLSATEGWTFVVLRGLSGIEHRRIGVCRRCHVVWHRPRHDAAYCSRACREVRVPSRRSEGDWYRVGGPRFGASPADLRTVGVERGCSDCERTFIAWREDQDHCERCRIGARRTARSRRRAAERARPPRG